MVEKLFVRKMIHTKVVFVGLASVVSVDPLLLQDGPVLPLHPYRHLPHPSPRPVVRWRGFTPGGRGAPHARDPEEGGWIQTLVQSIPGLDVLGGA